MLGLLLYSIFVAVMVCLAAYLIIIGAKKWFHAVKMYIMAKRAIKLARKVQKELKKDGLA